MKTLELRKATGSLAGYVGDAQKGPVVFTVKGDPVAALVPVTNADLEAVSLSSNRQTRWPRKSLVMTLPCQESGRCRPLKPCYR